MLVAFSKKSCIVKGSSPRRDLIGVRDNAGEEGLVVFLETWTGAQYSEMVSSKVCTSTEKLHSARELKKEELE